MDSDLIIVGGGLAGAALATVMAREGARVLVLERERQFRDRVRGETIHPWGVAEARALGLAGPLLERCAHPVRWRAPYVDGAAGPRQDLPATTPHGTGALDFFHPEMQETLIDLARAAGAEVRRGATVTAVTPGEPPSVTVDWGGRYETLRARLVVGADGRASRVRTWGGFTVRRDPEHDRISGLLFTGIPVDEDAEYLFTPSCWGHFAMLFPLGNGRVRAYFCTARRIEHPWLSGAARIPDFIHHCTACGIPAEWFARATAAGPLATFEAAAVWVDHPYRDGVALIGDAAGTSDPSFGHGQSLTLRDVRLLRGQLLANRDWDAAAHRYAAAHDRAFGALHTLEAWRAQLLFGLGQAADRMRAHALPQIAVGTAPDLIGRGPDQPVDEATRIRFLGT